MKNYFKISGFYGICTLILFSTMSMISKTTTCSQNNVVEQPTVSINVTQDGHVAAYVKNDKRYANTLFALQLKEKPSFKSPILLENCTVVVGKNYFIFSSKSTDNQVVLKLDGTIVKEGVSENALIFEGYGIIKTINPDKYADVSLITQGPFPPIYEYSCTCVGSGGSMAECDSGGEGATECSTGSSVATVSTSCQVSCGSGYSACCKD
jgi:hypothetical protein